MKNNDLMKLGIRRITTMGLYLAATISYSSDKSEENKKALKWASAALGLDLFCDVLMSGLELCGYGKQNEV